MKIVVRAFGQGPPLSAPVGVDIYGPEVDMLQRLGDEIQYIMSSIPAITESIQSVSAGDPELNIQIPSAISRSSGTGLILLLSNSMTVLKVTALALFWKIQRICQYVSFIKERLGLIHGN